MEKENRISCPSCGTSIDVQDILKHQLEDELKKKYQEQLNDERSKLSQEESSLMEKMEAFEEKKRRENEIFKEQLNKKQIMKGKEQTTTGQDMNIGVAQADGTQHLFLFLFVYLWSVGWSGLPYVQVTLLLQHKPKLFFLDSLNF